MKLCKRGAFPLRASTAPLAAAMLLSWSTPSLAAQDVDARIHQLQDKARDRIAPRGPLAGKAGPTRSSRTRSRRIGRHWKSRRTRGT